MKTFGSYLKDRNAHVFGGEPLAIHTSFYGCFLHKAIEEIAQYVDTHGILVNSAQEVVYSQFSSLFEKHPKLSIAERKELIEEYYSYCGFGKIVLKNLQPKGGYVETTSEHYGVAWKKIFGQRTENQEGVAQFTMGFLCGATEAIFNIALGTFDAKQIRCVSQGEATTRIDVFRGLRKKLKKSVGEGAIQTFDGQPEATAVVDYNAVQDALLGQQPRRDPDTGLIEAYGSLVARHYTNYFCLVSVRLLMELEKKYKREGVAKARSILLQSAQMGALQLFGRLVESPVWKENFAAATTQESQLHALLAFVNSLGWGKWEVEMPNPSGETTFVITGNAETNAILKMVGKTKASICFFTEGIVTGLMNLVYNADLTALGELNEECYASLFKADNRFVVVEAKTRMTGEELDKITVARKG